jgi:hypothetical protein
VCFESVGRWWSVQQTQHGGCVLAELASETVLKLCVAIFEEAVAVMLFCWGLCRLDCCALCVHVVGQQREDRQCVQRNWLAMGVPQHCLCCTLVHFKLVGHILC